MGVTQTLSMLQMHLMTPESESWFIAHLIEAAESGAGYRIVGMYRNQPDARLRGVRSEMHYGALVLHTHGPEHRPETVSGEYWTDRGTSGEMDFQSRIPALHTRFEDAERSHSA